MKIDMEKAFDRLEGSFIRSILLFYNFPHHLITLIMGCIFSSSYSLLINGTPTPFFNPSRGIR